MALAGGPGGPDARDLYRDGMGGLRAALNDTLVWCKRDTAIQRSMSPKMAPASSIRRRSRAVSRRPLRVEYLRNTSRRCTPPSHKADVLGYFVWRCSTTSSGRLGYSKRFGIVHVDFETQKRTPKDSALFYASVIASRGGILTAPA